MTDKFFLGANSAEGFFSLYDSFCCAKDDYLSVIKGGPGTGKSGFMRRIGRAAEERGYDVRYVLCSGDPDSLDGVYIPALRRGWADGTAPHLSDPSLFGIHGDYVNLGAFCRTPLTDCADEAEALYEAYQDEYGKAYAFLSAALKVRKAYIGELDTRSAGAAAAKRLISLLPKNDRTGGKGRTERFFLRCICGRGEVCLETELKKLSGKPIGLTGPAELAHQALKDLSEEAAGRGYTVSVVLSPLDTEQYEAVMIPDCGICAVNERYMGAAQRRIHPQWRLGISGNGRKKLSDCAKYEKTLMAEAVSHLANAKSGHDALEAVFKKAMDFEALTAFTDDYVAKLFA